MYMTLNTFIAFFGLSIALEIETLYFVSVNDT
jgi:hypothetical protein